MDHPRDYLPTLDQIEAALEAACGALITLESISPGASRGLDDADEMQRHVGLAIRSLRQAIEELRLAQSNGSSALAIEFVLNTRAPRGSAEPGPSQTKPRRTA